MPRSSRVVRRPTRSGISQYLIEKNGLTGMLIVYKHGADVQKEADYSAFMCQCVLPPQPDRSGAAADTTVRDIVVQLQEYWDDQFEASAVVWCMWASDIVRRDRSTWDTAITHPPPRHVANCLSGSSTRLERHCRSRRISGWKLSMPVIDSLRRDWRVFGDRLELLEQSLATRGSVLDGFRRNVPPPRHDDVDDPVPRMENLLDYEHEA